MLEHNILLSGMLLGHGALLSSTAFVLAPATTLCCAVCRLMRFSVETLYELHYQMITLGKVNRLSRTAARKQCIFMKQRIAPCEPRKLTCRGLSSGIRL